jgi:hypothetical protein
LVVGVGVVVHVCVVLEFIPNIKVSISANMHMTSP